MDKPLRVLPLTLVLVYLLSTVLLFFFGPLEWPVPDPAALVMFLSAALMGISLFYFIGTNGAGSSEPLAHWRAIIIVGAVSAVAILFPSAYYYADKMPWQILEALRDQNAVYEGLQRKLAQTVGSRTVISLIRAVTYPAIFAVLPLAILKWREMSWSLWLLLFATVLSGIFFSALRGTDREVLDLIIVASGSVLIVMGRWLFSTGLLFRYVFLKRRVIVGAILFLAVAAVAVNVFADRRVGRTGYTPEAFANGMRDAPSLEKHLENPLGWGDVMCIRTICLERDHWLVRYVDAPKKYVVLMLTSYLTQGYYGLSLALTKEFHSTLGIGHSPAVTRAFEQISGNTALYERGYTYALRGLDWSDGSQWSTIFPWLANDVSFPGAIFVISLLAFLWGRSWRDAIAGNDRAAIVFCLFFQLFIYVPANNQLAQTFDAYFAVTAWCGFWLIGSRILRAAGRGGRRSEMLVR